VLDGLSIEHPRYYFPPRVFRGWYGHCYKASVRGAFHRALRQFQPDIVHAPFAYPDGWAAVRLGHAANLPVVIQVHGSDVRLLDQYPARRRRTEEALRAADGVIVVSRDLQEHVIRMGVEPNRVLLKYDGVDSEVFHPGLKDEARKRVGLDPKLRQLLFVGRLDPVKGLDVLLNACQILQRTVPDFALHLIGEGPLRRTLEQQAERLGLGARVHFHGALPLHELATCYQAADVFVLPSHSEGVPNVLLEAMACRTPYVATHVGGIPEVAVPAVGCLVPPNDPAALAEALMAELVSSPRDPELWPAPRLRTTAVAEVASFLEAVKDRHARMRVNSPEELVAT
jgi:glycosyltransferase involved in cell wall biosynthesis